MITIQIPQKKIIVSESFLTEQRTKVGTDWVPNGLKDLVLVYYTSNGYGDNQKNSRHQIKLKMSSIDYPKSIKEEDVPDYFLGAIIDTVQKTSIDFS